MVDAVPEVKERNYMKELDAISRRFAFGAVVIYIILNVRMRLTLIIYLQCGALTGASFGCFDVIRDPKMMMTRGSVVSSKIVRFTVAFGGYVHILKKVVVNQFTLFLLSFLDFSQRIKLLEKSSSLMFHRYQAKKM